MGTPARSLVGFMEPDVATRHLRDACVNADASDAALIAQWQRARDKLGTAVRNAGLPDVQEFPPEFQKHGELLQNLPWTKPAFDSVWQGATVKLVEIAPLLAFQFFVDMKRLGGHCSQLLPPVTAQQLLPICLPLTSQQNEFVAFQNPHSMLIKARNLNLQVFGAGLFNAAFVGLQFGMSLPFVHVVRLHGRCYLFNGYHRAVGALDAGATHMPCIFRDVTDHASAGVRADGNTFASALLNQKIRRP